MSAPIPTSREGPVSGSNPDDTERPVETTHVIQLKPILEAQEEHGPIFRRELFDVAYAS
jgi:hypothetical protein